MTPDDDTAPRSISEARDPRKDWVTPKIELLLDTEIKSGAFDYLEAILITASDS